MHVFVYTLAWLRQKDKVDNHFDAVCHQLFLCIWGMTKSSSLIVLTLVNIARDHILDGLWEMAGAWLHWVVSSSSYTGTWETPGLHVALCDPLLEGQAETLVARGWHSMHWPPKWSVTSLGQTSGVNPFLAAAKAFPIITEISCSFSESLKGTKSILAIPFIWTIIIAIR